MGKKKTEGFAFTSDGIQHLDNISTALEPGGIERQEKAGQDVLVNSDLLPLQGIEEVATALGITYDREPVEGLFVHARLPTGWEKRASDHSMWSYIYDETGRKRAAIFYKAAFYDRRAHIVLESDRT